jgi:pheromone shutdown protein TraB
MKVIDNILLEWSYRCPDGIVDLNNPEKTKILFEILKPLLKEDLDDELLDALSNTDEDTKTKVLKLLKRTNKNISKDLKNVRNKFIFQNW